MENLVYLVNCTDSEIIELKLKKLGLKIFNETSDQKINLELIETSNFIFMHDPKKNSPKTTEIYELGLKFNKTIYHTIENLEFNLTYLETNSLR